MTVRTPAATAIHAVGDIHGRIDLIDLDTAACRRGILTSYARERLARLPAAGLSSRAGIGPIYVIGLSDAQKG